MFFILAFYISSFSTMFMWVSVTYIFTYIYTYGDAYPYVILVYI